MLKNTLLASAAVLGLGMSGAANADVLTWNFTGGSSASNGAAGNTRLFSSSPSGVNVTASAYFASSTGSNVQSAYLGHYSPGLGVTNSQFDDHYVDNNVSIDLVLFHFASPIDITSVTLTSYGDADIQAWFGNSFGGGSINGDFGMTDLGSFTCSTSCDGNGEVVTHNIDVNSQTGTYLLIAALPGQSNDEFKIRGLTANYTPTDVAEPGTLALLGLGLAGLGAATRRKRNA